MGGFRGFWGSPGTPPPFEKCISGRFPGARRPGFFGVTRATKRRRPERAKAGFAGQKGPLQAPLMCTIGRTGAEFAGPCWVRGAKGPFATPFMCTISRTAAELAGPCWVRSAFGFCGPVRAILRPFGAHSRRQGGAFDGVGPCPQLPRAKTPTKKVSAITRASDYTRYSFRGPRPCPSYKEMRVLWPASLPFVQKNAACVRRPTPFKPPALL